MGEWDIYCAICGAPFSSRVDIDPKGTEQNHYRYEILKNSSMKWLDEVRALGINADSPATDRNDEEAPHVFPFHFICYEDILLRCVWKVSRQLQRQVLFNAFEALHDWGYVRLNVDYGAPNPPEGQYWEANKGEEVLVVNPVKIPELDAHLGRITKYRGMSKKTAAKTGPQQQEIFSRLPIELRHELFRALPVGSILSLKAASAVMHATPLPARVWRRKLACEVPWLWELADCDVFQSQEVEYRASELLLNIDRRSRYTAENDDYDFGLANRRRIWGVCEQIRSKYLELLEGVSVLEG
ncbi:uncharacterized protein BO72DRAFT_472584 [Aspergillus fijiensis CBS 313.89]|uniref:F-box domain-containing protein n=1 Tax=Aspergillus fijiensis CBS 313.89 TaxID=1448319 RepID=A0A8G1RKP2_9EURO|nr:uncharacterized protein BO72DRAFT_472584 [Aspergillus fijiensis CBS 313.89]RAK72231.1 hypothetical protein BO72DRAFT_472584 [Aspergillus fijiensis CBS 313.89]